MLANINLHHNLAEMLLHQYLVLVLATFLPPQLKKKIRAFGRHARHYAKLPVQHQTARRISS